MQRKFDRQADEETRLPDASATALMDAGMFRLATPAARGGLESRVRNCLEVTATLAHGSPSAAWVAAVSYGAQHPAASFGDRVRSELWADTAEVPMCGALNAVGMTVSATSGGVLISGRWRTASGAYQAKWAVLAVPTVDEAGHANGRGLAILRSPISASKTPGT